MSSLDRLNPEGRVIAQFTKNTDNVGGLCTYPLQITIMQLSDTRFRLYIDGLDVSVNAATTDKVLAWNMPASVPAWCLPAKILSIPGYIEVNSVAINSLLTLTGQAGGSVSLTLQTAASVGNPIVVRPQSFDYSIVY